MSCRPIVGWVTQSINMSLTYFGSKCLISRLVVTIWIHPCSHESQRCLKWTQFNWNLNDIQFYKHNSCLNFIFQEQSYWTVQLGQSLALDYSSQFLSGCPQSFLVSVEINKCDITATVQCQVWKKHLYLHDYWFVTLLHICGVIPTPISPETPRERRCRRIECRCRCIECRYCCIEWWGFECFMMFDTVLSRVVVTVVLGSYPFSPVGCNFFH